MRKTVIATEAKSGPVPPGDERPLDLDQLARVEVTSEAEAFPVEDAFQADGQAGWRAGMAGPQTIRILFDQPATIRRMELTFEEAHSTRTQEFLLRWRDAQGDWRDVIRQQWNFSPSGSTVEHESVRVPLAGAAALELQIRPDTGGSPNTFATLRRWLLY